MPLSVVMRHDSDQAQDFVSSPPRNFDINVNVGEPTALRVANLAHSRTRC